MPKHDLIVIGAGPGGYVAAIRAAQLGLDVASVDEHEQLGGTCVRVGCIPSKALLESSEHYLMARTHLEAHGVAVAGVTLDLERMLARKDAVVKSNTDGVAYLYKKNGISHYRGRGEIVAEGRVKVHGSDGDTDLEADHIIIATGSQVATLPGIELDGDRIGGSTEALSYPEVPGHLVVIGAGYIGLELGSVWKRLGSKVTVLEYLDRILPGMDAELAKEALKSFKKRGLEFRLKSKVTSARVDGEHVSVEVEGADAIACDRVLVAVGRRPNTAGLGIEALGIALDPQGRIIVDDDFRTAIPSIYAIGDVIAGPMLAHKAEEEAVACVEKLVTGYGHVDYDTVPGIVYTEPEIASVGKTEEQLVEAGIAYSKGVFPYQANGRARALGQTEGKVKVLADAESDRILGVHIIGARAGDLIAEAVAAMTFGASAEDIARTVHAHPTLSEILKEAALGVAGRSIHI
ncbi:MAG: dihydrolipoyl dehydrogenase [Trueperaceae bacterium]|nr:MAG: dihydrolipoyl dehydrogenase [Trueperaceae bacterium]